MNISAMSYMLLVLDGIVLLVLGYTHIVFSGSCVGTEIAGPSNVTEVNILSPDQDDANTTTLFANTLYTIPCCGVVSKWIVAAEGAGKIRLQIWRNVPGTTNQYAFLGQNGWAKGTTGLREVSRTIPASSQVQVNTGDILALYHFGAAIVRYATCDPGSSSPSVCAESVYRAPDIPGSELTQGYSYTFNTLQSAFHGVTTVRTYAFQAFLSTKGQATCADETKSISDTLTTGSHVTNVSTENVDLSTSGSGITIQSMAPSVPITIDSQTGEITTTGALTPDSPSSTYVITLHVTDVCGQSNTCVLTLTVTSDAQPITFENLPGSAEVLQIPDVTVAIYTVYISRQRDSDDVACVVQSTSPVLDRVTFPIQNNSKTEYIVTMATDPTYAEADLASMALTVYCWNNQGFNNTNTLTLIFRPGTFSENRFWIIGFLVWFIVVFVVTLLVIGLCVTHGARQKLSGQEFKTTKKSGEINPDVIPAKIYKEPARNAFSVVNQASMQHRGPRDQREPVRTSSSTVNQSLSQHRVPRDQKEPVRTSITTVNQSLTQQRTSRDQREPVRTSSSTVNQSLSQHRVPRDQKEPVRTSITTVNQSLTQQRTSCDQKEPVRTPITTVNQSSTQHRAPRDPSSPQSSYSGYETSTIGSVARNVTPVSITSIGWIDSLEEEGSKQHWTSYKKSNSVSTSNSKSTPSNNYFRKKPWRP